MLAVWALARLTTFCNALMSPLAVLASVLACGFFTPMVLVVFDLVAMDVQRPTRGVVGPRHRTEGFILLSPPPNRLRNRCLAIPISRQANLGRAAGFGSAVEVQKPMARAVNFSAGRVRALPLKPDRCRSGFPVPPDWDWC